MNQTVSLPLSAPAQRHIPGEPGIWLLIAGDMLIFSLFFFSFAWYRADDIAGYTEAQTHLNQFMGMANTFVLLTSSWFVATAMRSAKANNAAATQWCFRLAFFCGAVFVVNKYFEYGEKIRAGITPQTGDFFMYYFVFTGIHLLHVLIGMVVLAFLASYAKAGNYDDRQIRNMESGASFWHVVDLLWIVLFALLYLAR